jgi:hypothetical protein
MSISARSFALGTLAGSVLTLTGVIIAGRAADTQVKKNIGPIAEEFSSSMAKSLRQDIAQEFVSLADLLQKTMKAAAVEVFQEAAEEATRRERQAREKKITTTPPVVKKP